MAEGMVAGRWGSAGPVGVLLGALDFARPTRIVDVGANPLSEPPYKPLLDTGRCELWGFEPQAEAFEALQKTRSQRETYYPFAVGDGGERVLNIYRESGLTSLFQAYEPTLSYLGRSRRNISLVEQVKLRTRSLDSIEDLPEFDLLKIDIQGGEVDVFRGGRDKLRGATVVIPELRFFPIYRDEPMMGGVDEELRDQGFFLHKFLFTKGKVVPNSQIDRLRRSAHRNQLIDGDAVYLRNMAEPEVLSDEQLRHVAVLAASVFESHDLALYCLDLLVDRNAADPGLPAAYVAALPPDLLK